MAQRGKVDWRAVEEHIRHPVRWLRGESLPEEKVRPWEMGAWIAQGAFGGLRNNFSWNTMIMYQNVFKIGKKLQSVGQAVTGVWDGLNDPVIGAYMDSRSCPLRVHKKVVRINAIVSGILMVLPFFDWGMTKWQHILMYIAVGVVKSLFFTASTVSTAKIWAHISPLSKERSKIALSYSIGQALHETLGGSIWALIGARDVLGISEYHIYLFGMLLSSLPCLFTDMLPTFVLQRVPDPPEEEQAEKRNVRQLMKDIVTSFSVMRYNRYFITQTVGSIVTTFTPSVPDNDFYRYCGVDKILHMGKWRGETIYWLRSNFASAPAKIIQPFSLGIMKRLGGARNTMVFYQVVLTALAFARFFAGVKTVPRLIFMWGTEVICWSLQAIDQVANNVVKYDMYDYVEWKTGRRSEGTATAVEGFFKKVVTDQLNMIVGNLVLARVGFNPELDLNQSASYVRWATRLYLLMPAVDACIWIVMRLLYKYPDSQRARVEAELIERRRIAEEHAAASLSEQG
jgi:Na+/melibiose symporter-like transporter